MSDWNENQPRENRERELAPRKKSSILFKLIFIFLLLFFIGTILSIGLGVAGFTVKKLASTSVTVESAVGEMFSGNVLDKKLFIASEIDQFKIDTVSAGVNLIKTNGSDITVEWCGSSQPNGQTRVIEKRGNQVYIVEKYKSVFNFGGSDTWINVYLPERSYDEFRYSTVSGNLEANSYLNSEDIVFSSTSGSMSLNKGVLCDELSFKSVSGQFSADTIQADTVDIKTTSGDSKIKTLFAEEININTVSGRASLTIPKDLYPDIRFSSVSGICDNNTNASNTKKSIEVNFKSVSGGLKLDN